MMATKCLPSHDMCLFNLFVFHRGKQRGVDGLLTCHEAWLLTVLTFASEAQADILGIDNLKLLSLKIL